MITEIQTFNEQSAKKLLCTNDFQHGTEYLPKKYAIKRRYVSLNRAYFSYLVFDIDRRVNLLEMHKACLPMPTLTVMNKDDGRGHLFYRFKTPIYNTENARDKPIKFMCAVYDALCVELGADEAYAGVLCKNPNRRDIYDITPTESVYELDDFKAFLPSRKTPRRKVGVERQGGLVLNYAGRNCTLFDTLRHYGYWTVKRHDGISTFGQDLAEQAKLINTSIGTHFGTALPARELGHTVTSVKEWIWKHRDRFGSTKNIGVMEIDKSLPLAQRQSMGADYTNGQRKRNMDEKIETAIFQLTSQGAKMNVSQVAMVAEVKRDTVYRYLTERNIAL